MYCTNCRDTISNKMIRPRSGRRALSENDAIDISEAKKSEILSRFKSENSERNVSRNPKDIFECVSSCKRCNERLLDVHEQISWNIQEKNQRELLESQFKCSICLELVVKGQLISKCPYGKSVSSKIPTKLFLDFCPEIFCSFIGAS